MRNYYLVLIFAFFAGFTKAQKYPFVNYSLENGLSNPNVTSVVEDEKGFIWVGTENGLNRFDGSEFKVFNLEHGLPHQHITNLCIINDKIVASTINGHLFELSGQGHVSIYNVDANELSEVYDLLYLNDTLWVAGMQGLYYYFNNELSKVPFFKDKDHMAISKIELDSEGAMYVSSHHFGIFRRVGLGSFTKIEMPEIRGVLDFAIPNKDELLLAGHYFIIYYTNKGLIEYRPNNKISRNWSNTILKNSDGSYWIGSDETGLYKFTINGKMHHFGADQGFAAKSVKVLFKDKKGVLWAGTNGNGLISLANTNVCLHSNFNDQNIIGLFKLNDGIWASSLSSGLYHYEEMSIPNSVTRSFGIAAEYDYFRGLPHDSTNLIAFGFRNRTNQIPKTGYTTWTMSNYKDKPWFGMNFALFSKEADRFNRYQRECCGLPSDVIYDLYSKEDTLWVALEVGAAALVNEDVVWSYKSPDSIRNSGRVIFNDSKNRLWLGGNKKGLMLRMAGGLKPALKPKNWNNTMITDIVEDEKGNIWVSSLSAGLVRIHNNGAQFFTVKNGLPSNAVMSIAFGADKMVIGTDRGVFSLSIEELYKESPNFYPLELSGKFNLPCSRNSAKYDSEGNFWVGTSKGVLQIDGNKSINVVQEPVPYLLNAQLLYGNTQLDSFRTSTGNVLIPYENNDLRFKVSTIYFSEKEGLNYSYYLNDGNKWSSASSSSDITFNNILPGEYTLKVRAKSTYGAWSKAQVLYSFSIDVPFWRTWWFVLGSILLVIISIVILISTRTKRLKQQNTKLEAYAKSKTKEVITQNQLLEQQNQEKEILLQEIHHRVKNNLQVIISLLRLQQRRVDNDSSKKVLDQSIGRIKTMSLIHQNLYQSESLAHTNFKEYLQGLMEQVMSSFKNVADIKYSLKGDELKLQTEVSIPLALISFEWVNNIYKHAFSSKKGEIIINLHESDVDYVLSIADNGKGISRDEFFSNKGSLGAKIIRTLAKQISANLLINRLDTGGTELKLIIGK
ncbi:MAG: hypothetical protein JXQ87_08360 [Bacteroidia bacterium]